MAETTQATLKKKNTTKMTTSSRQKIHIDLETYSEVDLLTAGVAAYVEHPSFEILLLGYAYGDDPVRVIDLAQGEEIPTELLHDLEAAGAAKYAHNAAFEMNCLAQYEIEIDRPQWHCTQAMAMMLGLPAALGQLSEVMNLDDKKMKVGKQLINFFCKPCKPTRANNYRTRNLPHHDPEKWALFKTYCGRDVESEREIEKTLPDVDQPEWERACQLLDWKINATGVLIDEQMVNNAIKIDDAVSAENAARLRALTGLDNPKSTPQFKKYLASKGITADSFTKDTAPKILAEVTDPEVKEAIALKLALSKTSTSKYAAMARAKSDDGRVRNLFKYYGANRTGRFAGRLVQLQNLRRNDLEELDWVRGVVREGDLDTLELIYDNVPDILSQLIRTALIAPEGKKFIVADFSAIEARVIAWLADEEWRQEVFKNGGDIYCASASKMFGVPVEKHGVNGHLRQKGKVAELALGYQGAAGALIAMGALDMGIPENELQGIVDAWRKANPAVKQLWKKVEETAAIVIKKRVQAKAAHGISMYTQDDLFIVDLPSGRKLCYQQPKCTEGSYKDEITYMGFGQNSKHWSRQKTYGGKLVENITQAIARDCLVVSMLNLDAAGYKIVAHVHDEVIIEAPEDASVEAVCEIMGQDIEWAPGLILTADGYETRYYKKD